MGIRFQIKRTRSETPDCLQLGHLHLYCNPDGATGAAGSGGAAGLGVGGSSAPSGPPVMVTQLMHPGEWRGEWRSFCCAIDESSMGADGAAGRRRAQFMCEHSSTREIINAHHWSCCGNLDESNKGCKETQVMVMKGKSVSIVNALTKAHRPVEARFYAIQSLNALLLEALPLIDLTRCSEQGSVAALLAACRGLIFECVKTPLWERWLSKSEKSSGSTFELRISRSRARKYASLGEPDHEGRWSVFGQAFRTMHTMPPADLRRAGQLYQTMFMGERSQDAGGPYRESFGMYTQELQSSVLPLLLLCANGREKVGMNREKWVLNPGATSPTHMEMYAFFGKLMGIAIRGKQYLALNIPSMIWKLLVGDVPTEQDLEGIDYSLVKSLRVMRTSPEEGFNDIFFYEFTATSQDGRTVELIPNGAAVEVVHANREQYCDAHLAYRLHEFDAQAEAIRAGLSTIIPLNLLNLFSWDQLELMVCGSAEVDIDLLKKCTEYSSISESDPHVVLFWQALAEFNQEERSALLRFTWGRSR